MFLAAGGDRRTAGKRRAAGGVGRFKSTPGALRGCAGARCGSGGGGGGGVQACIHSSVNHASHMPSTANTHLAECSASHHCRNDSWYSSQASHPAQPHTTQMSRSPGSCCLRPSGLCERCLPVHSPFPRDPGRVPVCTEIDLSQRGLVGIIGGGLAGVVIVGRQGDVVVGGRLVGGLGTERLHHEFEDVDGGVYVEVVGVYVEYSNGCCCRLDGVKRLQLYRQLIFKLGFFHCLSSIILIHHK